MRRWSASGCRPGSSARMSLRALSLPAFTTSRSEPRIRADSSHHAGARQRGLYAGVQFHRDLVAAHVLDGLFELNAALVDGDSMPLQLLGQVGAGHRAKQAAAFAGFRLDLQPQARELLGDSPGLFLLPLALAALRGQLLLPLLQVAGAGLRGQPPGNEIVAGVALGH